MYRLVLLTFIDLFVFVFNGLILARIILSYIMKPGNRAFAILVDLTEPVLAPVRRMLPRMGMLDLAPLVTFFLLQGIQLLAHSLIKA